MWRLRWHWVVGAVIGFSLPVPLAILVDHVRFARPSAAPATGPRISPMLDVEERNRLGTYHRHCQKSTDCEAPLGCLADSRVFTHYCTDSRCMTDAHCPEGLVCRSLATTGGGPLVRACVPLGPRQEGEGCLPLPSERDQACGPGLICAGTRWEWCGRPCRKDEAASCPEGFFCADLPPEPLCLPTCETRGCPEGQQCIRFDDGVSTCAVVYGPNCQHAPCPDGRECEVDVSARKPGKVWMECVEPCGKDGPACPEGTVCNRWHCQPSCDPQAPDTCGDGYRCQQNRPTRPWVCQPDR